MSSGRFECSTHSQLYQTDEGNIGCSYCGKRWTPETGEETIVWAIWKFIPEDLGRHELLSLWSSEEKAEAERVRLGALRVGHSQRTTSVEEIDVDQPWVKDR